MGLEIDSHGVKEKVSLTAEAGQRTFMDINKHLPAVVGDVASDHDSNMSIFNSRLQDGELSVLTIHNHNIETTGQITRGTCEARDKPKATTTLDLPSGQKEEVGETGTRVIGRFEEILASLRAVALTRDEAQKVENLLWDVKGELYAAEKRGRVEG